MERAADDFLQQVGKVYELNRKKWSSVLKKRGLSFSDDIYNDSIVKAYDSILKKEVDGDYMGYWFRTFLNNSMRDTKYSYHNRDDGVDVIDFLKDRVYVEYEDRTDSVLQILDKVKRNFPLRSYHLFLIYHMIPDMTYDELKDLTGISDCKGIIMRIREWIREDV